MHLHACTQRCAAGGELDFAFIHCPPNLPDRVVGVNPPDHPMCLAGARACPPDDCGGPPGYDRLLAALLNPFAPASAELLGWCGKWDPEALDLDLLNRLLSH